MKHQRPIYRNKPYVLLSPEGLVLSAGTLDQINRWASMDYYRNCKVEIRKHDLYLNDNSMLPPHALFGK